MTVSEVKIFRFADTAYNLSRTNHDFEESIVRTYWFRDPAEREIRLVHVDTDAFSKPGPIRPFYFGSSVDDGEFTPQSAIALVTESEERVSSLPDGWGEWGDATVWEWSN